MQISLQNKIRLTVLSIVLLFSPFMFLYFPSEQQKLLLESYNQEVQNIANTVALGVKIALTEQNFEGVQTALGYAKEDERLAFIALIQTDTAWSDDHKNFEIKKSVFSLSPENYPLDLNKPLKDTVIVKQAPFVTSVLQGEIMVGFSTKDILAIIRKIRLTSFLGSLIVSVCGLLLGFWLARSIAKPILTLRDATQKIGEGERNLVVSSKSKDEIGQLVKSFNDMVTQLARAENEILLQKEIIETKNKDITDSIRYAKRIQEAILPPKELIQNVFPDSFIFYRPKDIVSGDFYWFSQKNDKAVIVVADCTGHGVPGAIMSMIGNALLNETVNEKEYLQPNEILNQLSKGIFLALKKGMKQSESKDGMDIGLCVVDYTAKRLDFAGAYRPLYYFRNGTFEEIKSDKNPIGEMNTAFSGYHNHQRSFNSGDRIYLFTDGYVDQFGGTEKRKFMSKRFRELLTQMQSLTMDEQLIQLEKNIDEWKGKLEQVDDVLVLGIKL